MCGRERFVLGMGGLGLLVLFVRRLVWMKGWRSGLKGFLGDF